MSNNKEISVNDFETNLKNRYKGNGDFNVEKRVDSLVEAVNNQNKENNPYVFSNLLRIIEARDIRFRRTC